MFQLSEIWAAKEQQNNKDAWIEKRKLVTFIARIISGTYEIKSKAKLKIQVIVKYLHHLDTMGLKWEEVHDEFRIQSSRDSRWVDTNTNFNSS